MITSAELRSIPLFAHLKENVAASFAQRAADVQVAADDVIAYEGEAAVFFAIIAGQVELTKKVEGTARHMAMREAGDFFGEIPVMLQTTYLVTVTARKPTRLLRLDAVDFARLAREDETIRAAVINVIAQRVAGVTEETIENAPSVPIVVGTASDLNCFSIREFLTRNRIPFEWIDPDEADWAKRLPAGVQAREKHPFVLLPQSDGSHRFLETPSARELADALAFQTRPKLKDYDVAIIGGGPAGLAAAVYGASEGLTTLLIEKEVPGGQAGTSSRIENYLGFPTGLSGDELAKRAIEQAERFGAEVVVAREVQTIQTGDGHRIVLDDGETIGAKSIVLSLGVSYRRLEVDNCENFVGAGVYYGAARTEALSTRGEDVILVGGGNSAGQAAMFFSNYAKSVTLLVRGRDLAESMSAYLIHEMASRENIHIRPCSEIVSTSGNQALESVRIRDLNTEKEEDVPARAVFIFIGAEAKTQWLPNDVARDDRGFILTGRDVPPDRWPLERDPYLLETSVPGIFSAGDVRHGSIKRVAAGVGEGSMTIAFIHQFLAEANTRAGVRSVA